MKPSKILICVAVTAAAFMAFAANASALITSPAGTEFTGEVHETMSGSWILKTSTGTVTCTEATRIWHITTNDPAVSGGPITSTVYTKCTGPTIDVLSVGSLTVTSSEVKQTGGEVTVSASGISCVYGGGTGTKIGTVSSGTPGTMTESAKLPKISGGIFCSATAEVSAGWTITFPNTFIVE